MKVVTLTQNTQSIELKEAPLQIRTEPLKTMVVSQVKDGNDPETLSNTPLTASKLNISIDSTSWMALLDNRVNTSTNLASE